MSFNNGGTNITQRLVFNSGTIDFGNNRVVQLDNTQLSVEWTIADIYTLGSIVRQDIARHSLKVSLTGKIKSFAPEMEQLSWGSSTTGSPVEIDVIDGQPTLVNPILTFYDRNGKEVQYQLQNSMFKSSKLNSRAAEYSEWDFELEARDIILLYTA